MPSKTVRAQFKARNADARKTARSWRGENSQQMRGLSSVTILRTRSRQRALRCGVHRLRIEDRSFNRRTNRILITRLFFRRTSELRRATFSPFVEDVHHVQRSRHETKSELGATLGPGYRSVCRSEPNGLAERFQLVGTPANSDSHYAIAPKQPEVRANSPCSVPYKGPGSPRPRSLVQTIHPPGSGGRGTSGSPKTTRRDGGASPLSLPSR